MVDRRADMPFQGTDGRARFDTDLAASRHPIDRSDDLRVPPQHRSGLRVQQTDRVGDDVHGQGAGEVSADLGTPPRR